MSFCYCDAVERCLLRPARSDQSERTRLLKGQALRCGVQMVNKGAVDSMRGGEKVFSNDKNVKLILLKYPKG